MAYLEERPQFAMLAYAGAVRHDIAVEFVREALAVVVGIKPEWTTVHSFRLEDFLVVFARRDHRNLVAARPSIEQRGIRMFFEQWNRWAQAVHSASISRLNWFEGIPPHAWDRSVAEDLLGS
ncbi:hypothetical protein ZWY2020_030267 [Hordeum vulgare]|nr:hypothetical protein ZWY2020_030267 [Hordeum vulgare]